FPEELLDSFRVGGGFIVKEFDLRDEPQVQTFGYFGADESGRPAQTVEQFAFIPALLQWRKIDPRVAQILAHFNTGKSNGNDTRVIALARQQFRDLFEQPIRHSL